MTDKPKRDKPRLHQCRVCKLRIKHACARVDCANRRPVTAQVPDEVKLVSGGYMRRSDVTED